MENKILSPLGDRVLVQEYKTKEEKRTTSGIIIPETVSSEDVKMGKVIAVGPGLYTQNGTMIPMTVKIGDEVVLPPYGQAQQMKFGKQEYHLYRESELLGILKEDNQIELPF
jgi:chaperonin GroES